MSDSQITRGERKCSFCGRSEEQVSLLIPSGDGKCYICDNCINVCADFIEEQFTPEIPDADELSLQTLPRPKDIKAMLVSFEQVLEEREKIILMMRFGILGQKELTQREIGEKLNISRSYISRIEKKALEKLRVALTQK